MLPHHRAVIVGGGTMGADIAAIFAAGGYAVDIVQRPGNTRDSLDARVRKALAQLGSQAGDIVPRDTLSAVPWQEAGIVVETVSEDLELKQALFGEIERLAPPGIALASNSSSYPISRIAEGLKTRARMLGLHFFMPAHLVPLVEVVKSDATDPGVAQAVFDLMTEFGRRPVMVNRDVPGFLANRIQHALMREAWSLIERGIATARDVDTAVRYGFGFRYIAAGPILQKDLSGLEVNYAASKILYPDLCNDAEPIPTLAKKVAAGEIGVKAGKGFYTWTPQSIAEERARYETALRKGLDILNSERSKTGGSMQGKDFEGVTHARAVWDFTTGDEKVFHDRLTLMKATAESFRGLGARVDFALLLHGPVMKFVVKDVASTSFSGETIERRAEIHGLLEELVKLGARVEVCLISMRRRGVAEDNLMPFATIEENVFVNSIALQNKGYAVMHVD